MNDTWQFFAEPPPKWKEICQAHYSLFHTSIWQSLLSRSFNVIPLFALGADKKTALALSLFPAGPFRIGYVGFPAGGTIGTQPLTATLAQQLVTADYPTTVHLLKLVVSPFSVPLRLNYSFEETWETAVRDLNDWHEKQLSGSIRRDIRKANKNNVQIKQADPSNAVAFFALYQETIRRHGGVLRYSQTYFRQLLELAQKTPQLQCWSAIFNGEVTAFLVMAHEGETVFYLHGAIARAYQQYRSGDLLLSKAIRWAKDEGAREFNMMASPLDQPSLVWYKEKWGGVTGKQRSYDLPIRPAAAQLFRWLAKGYHLLNKSRLRW
jgi:hypothetical protein